MSSSSPQMHPRRGGENASVSTTGTRRHRKFRWPWKKRKKQTDAPSITNQTNGSSPPPTAASSNLTDPALVSVSYAAARAAAYDHNEGGQGAIANSSHHSHHSSSHGSYPHHKGGEPGAFGNSSPRSQTAAADLPGTSWLCRTKRFKKICDDAFAVIDTDGSGGVDATELYSGLLLIHLKLGMYLGPAACKPLDRSRCLTVFTKMDTDQSGYLDKDEFRHVMMVLFGNVLLRVMVQWAMTITIVPLVAQKLTAYLFMATEWLYQIIITLDERSFLANWIELAVEKIWSAVVLRSLPGPFMLVLWQLGEILESVPDSVWRTFPVTLISIILGVVVVPYIIFKIDDFFQWLVDRKTPTTVAATSKRIA